MILADSTTTSKLVVITLCGFIGMNFPLLFIVDQLQSALGFPVLMIYLFGLWIAMIVAIRYFSKRLLDRSTKTHGEHA